MNARRWVQYIGAALLTGAIATASVLLPEQIAASRDRDFLGRVQVEQIDQSAGGYRYQLTDTQRLEIMTALDLEGQGGRYYVALDQRAPRDYEMSAAEANAALSGQVLRLNQTGAFFFELNLAGEPISRITHLIAIVDTLNPAVNMAAWSLTMVYREFELAAVMDAETGTIYDLEARVYISSNGQSDYPVDANKFMEYLGLGESENANIYKLSERTGAYHHEAISGIYMTRAIWQPVDNLTTLSVHRVSKEGYKPATESYVQ